MRGPPSRRVLPCLMRPSPTGSFFLLGSFFRCYGASSARWGEVPSGVLPGVASRLTARSPRAMTLVVSGRGPAFGAGSSCEALCARSPTVAPLRAEDGAALPCSG
ncbi:hypothetical protein NDU88_003844 [Pleurodeles waltl]|uniref:Secreted protein n=1 Tax=Pleurodeles waltl TaxID=8319 RepID=A0AAV7VEF6_PLEWA|nr:hypothetical protein NDU88_003844 [Pleurodeles waltl]